jgi:hypothetical protein
MEPTEPTSSEKSKVLLNSNLYIEEEELLKIYMLLDDDEVVLYKKIHIFSKQPIEKYEDLIGKKIIKID